LSENTTPLRLLIAGGGTGGHVLPAVAVIEELRSRNIPMELLWVGSQKGVEESFTAEENIPFTAIQTGKLRRYFSLENIMDATRLPIGTLQAWNIVRNFRPDAIFATGGSVSVPTVIAGHRRAPVLTHEQTAQVGISNKISSRFVRTFACSYEATAEIARTMHDNVVVTGNPVRRSLMDGRKDAALQSFGMTDDLPLLFVTGGARGASAINDRIEAMLPGILEVTQIVHQTGPASANPDYVRLSKLRESLPVKVRNRYQVRDMIRTEMADLYAAADLVIGRAGAGTVAELAFTCTPAILIPLGGTWGDEQRKNAALLQNADAALVLEQDETPPETLESVIRELMRDPDRLRVMATNAQSLSRGDAAANVADEILKLAGR
jgi:UDP-N-acetylglucosamine--N-acetylmuramyl-(pentapeptide) pyrophosphoryl-undecaprenol N-acetylglucosamine transferase